MLIRFSPPKHKFANASKLSSSSELKQNNRYQFIGGKSLTFCKYYA